MDPIDRELISALHDHRWEEVLEELTARDDLDPSSRARVETASRVTAQRRAAATHALGELVAELSASGVEVSASGDAVGLDGKVVLRTETDFVLDAASALERMGYMPQHALSPGAKRALVRAGRDLVFLPVLDPRVTRVVLQQSGPSSPGHLGGMTRPGLADVRAVPLPEPLWWSYWLIRPVRIIADRVFGRRRSLDSPYLSTPTGLIGPTLALVSPAPGDRVVDLGCGDGRVVIEAARTFDCLGLGVELDPRLVVRARAAVAESGLGDRVEIVQGDLESAPLKPGDVVFLFLPPSHAARVLPTLMTRVTPGGRVVAHEQARADWPIAPSRTHLVVHPSGVTVAHVWEAVG